MNTNPKRQSGQHLILSVLFFGSGCSALIYEIVWFQMLQLVIGSSSVSLGVLLSTYMGGMCLGSLLFPKLIGADRNPLRVYAMLELMIGICGAGLLVALPWANVFYQSLVSGMDVGVLPRILLAVFLLLAPTMLMGATLPAIGRWVDARGAAPAELGWFYAMNLAGAVFGCLLAGFVLLRLFDLNIASAVAVAINLVVAVIAWQVARKPMADTGATEPADFREVIDPSTTNWDIYLVIGISGATALGSEVVWTRLMALLLGATVYSFSIILAVFLTGLGLGSAMGTVLGKSGTDPRKLLAGSQLLAATGIAWTGWMISASLPFWPVDVSMPASDWNLFQLDLLRTAWAVIPATLAWGASFPLAVEAVRLRQDNSTRAVSRIYAANTAGAILGAVLVSMWFIPGFGTASTQRILLMLLACGSCLLLIRGSRAPFGGTSKRHWSLYERLLKVAVVGCYAVWACTLVSPIPDGVIGYGRYYPTYALGHQDELPEFLYSAEGTHSSIAVSVFPNESINFHVSGKIVASSDGLDMRLQRMLGHLPALIHPAPRKVLIVGCGASVTAGSFVPYPGIEKIVICEVEPLIPNAAKRYFSDFNHQVFDDPRVEVVIDDARHYLGTTKERFDIITSDPIHPWVKGAASLYSKEYFELCKSRLNAGGLVTQWVPLYETNRNAVCSQVTTFMESFPGGTIWGNESLLGGYDIVLLGGKTSQIPNLRLLEKRHADPRFQPAIKSLQDVKIRSAFDLLKTYGGRQRDLQPWLDSSLINRDANLRLQYIAGLGLNTNVEGAIYDEILQYRQYPADLFEDLGPELKKRLRNALGSNDTSPD